MSKVTSYRKHIIQNTIVSKVKTDCMELVISSFTFLRWSKTNSQAINVNVVISDNLLGSYCVVGRSGGFRCSAAFYRWYCELDVQLSDLIFN